jgi:hypothetical protein
MPFTNHQVKTFPEKPRSDHGADEEGKARHFKSSQSFGYGHEESSERMDHPFNDPWSHDETPCGSAPASGEGINASSKPQGRDIKPERA